MVPVRVHNSLLKQVCVCPWRDPSRRVFHIRKFSTLESCVPLYTDVWFQSRQMSTIKKCLPETGACYRERERCAPESQACAVKCPLASLHVGAVCKGYLHHKVVVSMWTLTGRGPASSFSSSLTSGIFSSKLSSSKNKSSPTTAALIKKRQ